MAQIERRGKGHYRARIRSRGIKKSKTFPTIGEAREWLIEQEGLIKGGIVTDDKLRLSDAVEQYLNYVQNNEKVKRWQLKQFCKYLGDVKVCEVSVFMLVQTLDRIQKERHLQASTRNRYLAAISHFFNTLLKWRIVAFNPALGIEKAKEAPPRQRFLSNGERERLLETCRKRNADLYLAVRLALSTGARQAEIWQLEWSSVKLDERILIFRKTKTNKPRAVLLTGSMVDELRKREKVSRFVFPSPNLPDQAYDMKRPFMQAMKEAGIEDFRWHDLRHTFISYAAMNGLPSSVIAQIVGHTSVATTERIYTHISQAHLNESVQRVADLLLGENENVAA